MHASFELSTTSVKRPTNMPVASYLRTDTGQKRSMFTSEFVESNRFTDSVQSSTVVIPHMPDVPSMTTPIKPADYGHTHVTTVTIENETNPQCQPLAEVPVSSEFNHSDKMAVSSSSVVGKASDSSSGVGTVAAVKGEKFPYRVLRCDVETDLEAGLQAYFELDVLDKDNKFMCDVCTSHRVEKKGTYVCITMFILG